MRDRHTINFTWLVRLRFWAIAGQCVIIGVAAGLLNMAVPLFPLAAIVATELAINLMCARRVRSEAPASEVLLAGVVAFDLIALTALLYFTGGPLNPFSVLYLVDIVLAAVVLRPAWIWPLVTLAIVGFAALFATATEHAGDGHSHDMRMHLEGMWVAFATSAVFTVYFVTRMSAELASARDLAQRQARVAALATLAAGAAHELATPLATIATVAKELERQLVVGDAAEDARLIRSEVDRCHTILRRMATDAGQSPAEASEPTTVRAVLDASLDGLDRSRVLVDGVDDAPLGLLPLRPVASSLRALIHNALEAAPPSTQVALRYRVGNGRLELDVEDRGAGMIAEVLAHVGEPFFTTKEPGRGMGLGVFVARSVLERLGGGLVLESTPGAGTRARLVVPVATGTFV